LGHEATFEDWLALLSVRPQVHGLLEGTETYAAALAAVRDRRAVYPGVSEDYVAVIDAVVEQLEPVADLIAEQEQRLEAFAEAIDEVRLLVGGARPQWRLPDAAGRLLTADERADLERIRDELRAAVVEHTQEELARIEREREDLEAEAESLAAEIEARRADLGDPDEDPYDGWDDWGDE
jgi:hypothetical protein